MTPDDRGESAVRRSDDGASVDEGDTTLDATLEEREGVCVCIRQQCLTPVSCHYRVSHIIESLTFFLYSADTC